MNVLETIKFEISKIEELKKVKKLVKEILDETITEEYITPYELIEIIKDFANKIEELQYENKQLQKEIDEGLEHYYYPRNFGI